MDLSGLRSASGRALRGITPQHMALPILTGPLMGEKWILRSGNLEHFLGIYERTKISRVAHALRNGSVFFDIGAHVGYYSILASRLVGDSGTVVAFEPLPRNVEALRQHIALNNCMNVVIIESAVTDAMGESRFLESADTYTGRLTEDGCLDVKTVSIDALHANGLIPAPDCVKIDVEGTELSVLSGSREVLAKYSPVIFLATHDHLLGYRDMRLHKGCSDILTTLGYEVAPLDRGDSQDYPSDMIACKLRSSCQ